MTKDEVLALYEDTRKKCFAAAEDADRRPRLSSLEEVMAPLAPYSPDAVAKEAARVDFGERREEVFGGKDKLPEKQAPRHMAIQRSEEHTSELQSLMRTSYAVFCLKKK